MFFFHITRVRLVKYILICSYLFFLLCFAYPAYSQPVTEYEVKAALLLKFIDFVKWPSESFSEEPDSFILGILGYDFFDDIFDPVIGKKIQGKTFKIKRFCTTQEIKQVQILFISASEKEKFPWILRELEGRDILTVGDTKGFARQGGIINFFVNKKGTVRFKINIDAKNRTKLKISSHLLRLAKIVSDNETQD